MGWNKTQQVWLKRYLKPQIDRVWSWWPPRKEARKLAIGSSGDEETQICAGCGKEFKRSETHVDHIDPTVDVNTRGFEDPGEYVKRKFVQVEGLQILCKATCHKNKSVAENAHRPHRRNKGKTHAK